MEPSSPSRHQLIKDLMPSPPLGASNAPISAWEQMASKIISIVGEDGFNALLARTIFLGKASFPWLPDSSMEPLEADHRLAELKMSFEGQAPAQASEASILLLITFTDILASLIGEELTTRILRLAWCTNISSNTAKEPQNG